MKRKNGKIEKTFFLCSFMYRSAEFLCLLFKIIIFYIYYLGRCVFSFNLKWIACHAMYRLVYEMFVKKTYFS